MPRARGPKSAYLLDRLKGPVGSWDALAAAGTDREDLHLCLYLCYELHYLGIEGVDSRWEWDPSLLAFRGSLEEEFIKDLLDMAPIEQVEATKVEARLIEIAGRESHPSLSEYLATEATVDQFREFVAHRSLYHLKEADPHSWAIPRLFGKPKAALIEIQADEYGGGREPWMHSNLFRKLMNSISLDARYGRYLDNIPGVTLATVNLMSMLGLHQRWRGALTGHLALFEMTSSGPNRLYGDGLRRLNFDEETTHFYDEHVEADSLHEAIAAHDLAAGLALQQPELAGDIIFGAECLAGLDERAGRYLLDCWAAGGSSLREPLSFTAESAPKADAI